MLVTTPSTIFPSYKLLSSIFSSLGLILFTFILYSNLALNKNHQIMNENRERGTLHYKFLTTIAIVALLIGSNTALAIGTNSEGLSEIAEQLQSQVVNGTIIDQTGEPVIGASVLEKGTNNGIITNIDGKFSLTVKRGATLVISFVGYKTLEVKATPKMEITLTEDSELLEEVKKPWSVV